VILFLPEMGTQVSLFEKKFPHVVLWYPTRNGYVRHWRAGGTRGERTVHLVRHFVQHGITSVYVLLQRRSPQRQKLHFPTCMEVVVGTAHALATTFFSSLKFLLLWARSEETESVCDHARSIHPGDRPVRSKPNTARQ
jgi:hypothetical protein